MSDTISNLEKWILMSKSLIKTCENPLVYEDRIFEQKWWLTFEKIRLDYHRLDNISEIGRL